MAHKKPVPVIDQQITLDLARKHGISVEIVADIIQEATNGTQ